MDEPTDAAPTARRTWPQRLTLVTVIATAVACFVAAGVLAAGQWVLSQRQLVELDEPTVAFADSSGSPVVVVPGATTTTNAPVADDPAATTTTIPLAEPDAANFLITGADNGDCIDSSDVTVGDRSGIGERSDTIMVWRLNPDTDQLAVLSFPRDLWVDRPGQGPGRINSTYERDDPSQLIDTINLNFGIPIDHYIQVDFCAFRRLVDAVGGVEIPFQHPARDQASGLVIAEAGCVTLDGDMALAYVRSRKYQYEDPAGSGNWTTDGTSDFGRIARQQDFLRRTVAKVVNEGLYSPDVASALIETNRKYVVTDTGLTLTRMLEFANTLRTIDPAAITTFRIESYSDEIGGASVERPSIRGENMQSILSIFRGEASLASAPEQVFDEATPTTLDTTTTIAAADSPDDGDGPTTTLPSVTAEENTVGVAPDRTVTCS